MPRGGFPPPTTLYAEPLLPTGGCTMIAQGAEARVWEAPDFLGAPAILKQRFSKEYRHPDLDAALTLARVRAEARALLRARRLGVRAPALLFVDVEASTLYLEKIRGTSLKDVLRAGGVAPARAAALAAAVGAAVARLHDGGLVHGDLTTSNLVVPDDAPDTVVVIDFGLASTSTLAEDRAVDLYVLERALDAAHAGDGGGHAAPGALFDAVKAAYRQHARCWCAVLNKFAEVRLRGRKRSMVG